MNRAVIGILNANLLLLFRFGGGLAQPEETVHQHSQHTAKLVQRHIIQRRILLNGGRNAQGGPAHGFVQQARDRYGGLLPGLMPALPALQRAGRNAEGGRGRAVVVIVLRQALQSLLALCFRVAFLHLHLAQTKRAADPRLALRLLAVTSWFWSVRAAGRSL